MIKMQYDKNNNCHYCGYGPQYRSPNWSNEHPGVCCVTHAYDPPEKAKNENEWRKLKKLPRNFSSGGDVTIKVPQKRQPRIRPHKRRPKSARKMGQPKKANRAPPAPPPTRAAAAEAEAPPTFPIKNHMSAMRWNGMKNGEV
jgi:hypothetical protein